ncbi:MAG: hypothetical protein KGI27_04530 [Thaumarchaeota archaeon]|nr:hypothetical protein [Nitrososphaerota archaeon]
MRTRRGIASVVGMVFAIIALTTTIAYISYSMGILNNFNQSVLVKNQQLTDVDKEKFQISSVTVPNGKLDVTVANTGSLPIQFTKMWIQNTSATDWANSYVPTNNMVSPGGVLTNIGQNIPVSINPANSYNVKLVTSRGNTQQFTMNSIGAAPVNIQFYAFPSAIPSGYTTELVMIVTNNQSSTLVNITPQISKWTGTPSPSNAACTPSVTSSPPSVSTLAPGSTAVFKWDLKIIGNPNQFCTYAASLQNGFPGNTASTTATVKSITATSSNWSTTWGILSINYTSLQYAQNGGSSWTNNWSVPCSNGGNGACKNTDVWRMSITNNDPTRSFILNGNTTLIAFSSFPGSNTATQFFIINNNYPSIHPYPTNGQTIPANSTVTVYFGTNSAGGSNPQSLPSTGQFAVSILTFGYWDSIASNNFFGQNIPYEGIISS